MSGSTSFSLSQLSSILLDDMVSVTTTGVVSNTLTTLCHGVTLANRNSLLASVFSPRVIIKQSIAKVNRKKTANQKLAIAISLPGSKGAVNILNKKSVLKISHFLDTHHMIA